MANDRYAVRAPFSHFVDIESTEDLRPGVTIPESGMLGELICDLLGDTRLEVEIPYAYAEMLDRSRRLVVRPVEVTMLGRTRTVYVAVAVDEADVKVARFSQWANVDEVPAEQNIELMPRYRFWSDFFGTNSRRTIGWWALGYQVAWALTPENAQKLIDEAFQPMITVGA